MLKFALIDTQTHTQKIKILFFILNYLIQNLQAILKILKLKTQILKKFKTYVWHKVRSMSTH